MTRRQTFWRYTAFQVPGWAITAYGGWWLHQSLEVPVWIASSLLVVWVIKDYALFPFLRSAYELDHRLPIEQMIETYGYATEPLSPTGYIRIRGELWRARTTEDNPAITRGAPVKVTGVDGTTLLVKSVVARQSST
jgi:membrane protein implicated in regulation of membrane protease activity